MNPLSNAIFETLRKNKLSVRTSSCLSNNFELFIPAGYKGSTISTAKLRAFVRRAIKHKVIYYKRVHGKRNMYMFGRQCYIELLHWTGAAEPRGPHMRCPCCHALLIFKVNKHELKIA
jgi:hypothetical protein